MSYLVEAEATGPIEGEDAIVTPPRPPHRRVSVSLILTLTVLTGTVVAIFLTFPGRNTVLMNEALARHRDSSPTWNLVRPTPQELRAWAIGVLGKDPPLPQNATILGARDTAVLDRRAAIVQVDIAGEPITYLVQHTRVISPAHSEETDGDLRAVAWHKGEFTAVAVGRDASATQWSAALAP